MLMRKNIFEHEIPIFGYIYKSCACIIILLTIHVRNRKSSFRRECKNVIIYENRYFIYLLNTLPFISKILLKVKYFYIYIISHIIVYY
jgi:hypothetical protein